MHTTDTTDTGNTSARLLIATPDGATRLAIARTAARHDVTALVATDGASALAAAIPADPLLIGAVIDIDLRDSRGLDVVRAIRAESAGLPILLICDDLRAVERSLHAHTLLRSAGSGALGSAVSVLIEDALLAA